MGQILGADLENTPEEVRELLPYLTDEERREIGELLSQDTRIWRPLPGPQYMAYLSEADVLGYGGAAGGGKTDLMCGSALTKHHNSLLMRREYTQMKGIVQRMTEIMGGRDGYNGQDKIWRIPGTDCTIEFGSVPHLGDEMNFQGRPRDLLGIDEAANFLKEMVVFLMGWVRTVIQDQSTQTIMTFNPPTTAEGRWIVDYYAAWLDDNHPNPAQPGELRYFAMIEGEEHEVEDEFAFYHNDELVIPTSRTFVPSRVADNPFLMGTNYIATLQAMPEPLRSQMLYGDFKAGMTDDIWQVIPTAWVDIAMDRWTKLEPKPIMDSLGVDVARGGDDKTTIARRHGFWFDEALEYPGKQTPDGHAVVGLVIAALRDQAPIHIDVIGVGASPYDILMGANQQVIAVDARESTTQRDKSGKLKFRNMRSWMWWNFREMLDPEANNAIALPPDKELRAELCAPIWKSQGATVYVESREEIIDRIGRSPDKATAYIQAAIDTPRAPIITAGEPARERRAYDPMQNVGPQKTETRRKYNPFKKRS